MALQGNALKEYNAQFQRSIASPEALSDKKKPVVLDGAAVLDKYIGGESAAAMTGAEFYALVGHIKRQHGQRGEALEQELMKVTRQMDKKIRLLDWCTTNPRPQGGADRAADGGDPGGGGCDGEREPAAGGHAVAPDGDEAGP